MSENTDAILSKWMSLVRAWHEAREELVAAETAAARASWRCSANPTSLEMMRKRRAEAERATETLILADRAMMAAESEMEMFEELHHSVIAAHRANDEE